MNSAYSFESSMLSRDPHVVQDILNSVEHQYYSMTFDSGRYEIENLAGPSCRELSKLKLRLLFLDKQNKAVSRRVSELVLEQHPLYEAELNGVLSLQTDNWETLALCRRIRRSLKLSDHALVHSRLTVLRNFRRLLRLRHVVRILHQIRVLQQNVHLLDTLLNQGNFHAAIELHRESLVVLEDYRQYRCVEPIHLKLQAFGMRIEDLLDSELQMSCEHFSDQSYTTVQQAFELLGSTQTTFAQLQMHYISAIQRRAFHTVRSFVSPSDKDTDADESCTTRDYADLCLRIPLRSVHTCLQRVCQNLWLILLCYHQTIVWHQQRASGKQIQQPGTRVQQLVGQCSPHGSSRSHGSPTTARNAVWSDPATDSASATRLNIESREDEASDPVNGSAEDAPEGASHVNGGMESELRATATTAEADEDTDDDDAQQQQLLIRQWHDYVASKLTASRQRIWAEVSGRIESILKCVGQFATDMHFDQIASVLKTVNHLVLIGEDFCGSLCTDLLEVLRTSIYKFFRDFHRKHMERLKMFLENETWECCPVKSSFTVMDLHEYRALISLLQTAEVQKQSPGTSTEASTCVANHSSRSSSGSSSVDRNVAKRPRRFFEPPYVQRQFPVPADSNSSVPAAPADGDSQESPTCTISLIPATNSPLAHRLASTSSEALSNRPKCPLLSNTTLEVLRLIGRYLQMMNLLQPIAGEVMHCVCQVFDYYLYSIFMFFGPLDLLDSSELPERLRLTLKRIGERLIATEGHSSVMKGSGDDPIHDRFALPEHEPMHVLRSIGRFQETTAATTNLGSAAQQSLWIAFMQAHLVGVESVIYLADILEQVLLPHLSTCIPERKRAITLVFREQSLLAARQLREPCALQTIPILLNLMLPSSSGAQAEPANPNTGTVIASGLSKLWPLGATSNLSSKLDASGLRPTPPPPSAETTETNPLIPLVSSVSWTRKQVATKPNPYVNHLHSHVFLPFAAGLQLTAQRLGLSEANKSILWNTLLTCIGDHLLNAYGQVHACSEEGRSQMLLDVQSIAALAESVSKLRPFPKLEYVIEYIQAFYVPVHEWEHWLTQTGIKYSRSQLTGLAHCLSRGDRRQRQRLLNTINQIYNTAPGVAAGSSTSLSSSHSMPG